MNRQDYPNSAFGYVSADETVKLLLHHDPEYVQSGDEHDTVDPALLMFAIKLTDIIPVKENNQKEIREKIYEHLEMHADVILWSDPDTNGLPIALHDKLRDFAFFKAHLEGASEVPPVTTEGRGTAYILYNKRTKEMSWFVQFLGLKSRVTSAHFYTGKSGDIGKIMLALEIESPKYGSVKLTDEKERALFEGNTFINILSVDHPSGEIRGQLMPAAVSRSNAGDADVKQTSINIPTDKENAPKSDETVKKIQKTGNPTGVESAPPADKDAKNPESMLSNLEEIDKLPDAAFAVIERGGLKDENGKVMAGNLRHLPHHTCDVKDPNENDTLDLQLFKYAISQIDKITVVGDKDNTDRIRRVAKSHLEHHMEKAANSVSDMS